MRPTKRETMLKALLLIGVKPGTRLWLKSMAKLEPKPPRRRVVIDLLSVVCPRCLAKPGEKCRTQRGPRDPHRARGHRARRLAGAK